MSVIIGAILSWPALVIYGLKKALTPIPSLKGQECSTADEMKKTPYPLIYYGTLIFAFLITFSIFVTLYVRIGREINRRRTMFGGDRPTTDRMKSIMSEEESTTFSEDDNKHCKKDRKSNSLTHLKEQIVYYFRSESDSGKAQDISRSVPDSPVKLRRKSSRRYLRTTYIFLAVFIAFLISFVPYLIVNILRFSKVAFVDMNSGPDEVVYNLCVRSYFISNFINPIIYSLLNRTFRTECRKLFHNGKLKLLCKD